MKTIVLKDTGLKNRDGEIFLDKEGSVYALSDVGQFKVIIPNAGNRGYHQITIQGKTWYIHRLMYQTFIGPLKKGMVIDHIDECKGNNSVKNLQQISNSCNLVKHYMYIKELEGGYEYEEV